MDKLRVENPAITDFYFNVWCERLGYTQVNPWKIQQLVAQTMEIAAELFVKDWDDKNINILTRSRWTGDIIIYVQDWRGIITKFAIERIEIKYNYILRKIK